MNQPGYAIAWTAPARRALARLPEKIAAAVVEFLYGSLAANPHQAGKPGALGCEVTLARIPPADPDSGEPASPQAT